EIVLCPRPLLWEGVASEDRKGCLICLDGLLDVVGALPSYAVTIGGPEIVLCLRPLLREGIAGPDREGCLIGLDGLLDVVGALPLSSPLIGIAQVNQK